MRVSIITVCYNSARTIEQTIKSVITQDYDDVEYIIIDGGSKDGTLDIIDKYMNGINKVISEPDSGIYDAMNKGIRLASGEIIGIINSDDWYGEGTIAAAVACLKAHPECGVAHGREIDIYANGGMGIKRIKTPITEDFLAVFCHPTFFVRKLVYEEVGLFDCKYPTDADGDLVYRMYFAGIKFCYDDDIVAYFRMGTGASASSAAYRERLTVHRKYARRMPSEKRNKAVVAINRIYDSSRLLKAIFYLDSRINWCPPVLHPERYFVIFGFGVLGQKLADWLIKNGRKSSIKCFIDNNPLKQKDTYKGIGICASNIIKECDSNTFFVITTSNYYDEVAQQLRTYGLLDDRDFCGYFDFKAYVSDTDITHVKSWVHVAKHH